MALYPFPAMYSAKIRAMTSEVFGSDERVQALAVSGLGGVGVRADVHELLAVGRTAAEEPAL